MGWEARIIEALQSGYSVVLDYLMFALTYFGDEIFFLAIVCIIYWCFSKKFAFRFLNVYIVGAGLTEGLKRIFRRPRPFQKYTSIRAIIHQTSGFSFPSGHSRSIGCIAAMLTKNAKSNYKKATFLVFLVLVLIVMLSRMYLGQHYLTDVIVGASLGVVFALVCDRLYNYVEAYEYKFYVVLMPLCLILILVLFISGHHASMHKLIEGAAAYSAASLAYALENKFVAYQPQGSKKINQLIKVAIGLGGMVLIILAASALAAITTTDSALQTILASLIPYQALGFWTFLAAPAVFKKLKL